MADKGNNASPDNPLGFRGVSEGTVWPDDAEGPVSQRPSGLGLRWSSDGFEPCSTPLPFGATMEPTQRGLGIPPPPSSGVETPRTWDDEPRPLSALAILSEDIFRGRADPVDAGPASVAEVANEVAVEPTENERVTVRAPAAREDTRRTRRLLVLAAALIAAVVLAAPLTRRATTPPHAAGVDERAQKSSHASLSPGSPAEGSREPGLVAEPGTPVGLAVHDDGRALGPGAGPAAIAPSAAREAEAVNRSDGDREPRSDATSKRKRHRHPSAKGGASLFGSNEPALQAAAPSVAPARPAAGLDDAPRPEGLSLPPR